jgi:hypothetical protein
MSLSNLDSIKLRSLSDPTLTAKGSELTWDEEDENFVIIHDAISELANVEVSGVDPYDAGTEYSTADPYVTYNGNTWQYINAIPQTGVTPGTDALTWSLVSNGLFTHQQNTDTILANGTADEVSAAEIRAFIDAGGSTDDSIYSALWNGVTTKSPSKNAVYDKIELLDAAKLNLSGGTMTGDIDMSTNDIFNIRTLSGVAGSIDLTGTAALFGMDIDMDSNDIINVNSVYAATSLSLGHNSEPIFSSSSDGVIIDGYGHGLTLKDTLGGGVYIEDHGGGGIFFEMYDAGGLYHNDWDGGGIYYTSYGGEISWNTVDGVGAESIGFTFSSTDGVVFTDSRTIKKGIEYGADYSSDLIDLSLIHKGFADARYATIQKAQFALINSMKFLTGN